MSFVQNKEGESRILPEEFSPLGLYGNRDFFQKAKQDGYTEVAFGGGKEVGAVRPVGVFAFFHPDTAEVRALITWKLYNDVASVRSEPTERAFPNMDSFEDFLEEFKIELGERVSLEEILKPWKVKHE